VPIELGPLRAFLARYAELTDEEIKDAATAIRPESLASGEFLVRAGQPSTTFGFVQKGLLRKFYTTAKGRELTRGFAVDGELVGVYAALLTSSPSQLSVQALEDCQLLMMDYSALQQLYARHPGWCTLGRRVAEQLFLEREEREFTLLTLSASERYDRFRHARPDIMERVPQYEIASYLGITPVSLSRIRARVKKPR
jgi:CRP-like cAMP-binding protein